jgi:CysZ protein
MKGLVSPFMALGLFRSRPRLLLFLLLAPWGISLLLFLGGWSLLTLYLTGQVAPVLDANVEAWWGPLLTGFGYFVAVLVAAGLAYGITVIGAVVVAAPFHDRLSAAAENALRPEGGGGGRLGMVAAFREGLKTALVLLILELSLLPLLLLPGVGHALFALLSAFFLTVGLMDVTMARREMTLRQKAGFVTHNLGAVFGLSLAVLLVSFLPFINLLTVPIVVMAGAVLVVHAAPP